MKLARLKKEIGKRDDDKAEVSVQFLGRNYDVGKVGFTFVKRLDGSGDRWQFTLYLNDDDVSRNMGHDLYEYVLMRTHEKTEKINELRALRKQAEEIHRLLLTMPNMAKELGAIEAEFQKKIQAKEEELK